MTDVENQTINPEPPDTTAIQVGFYSAIFMAVITVITFGFAMTAIPISGAYCPGNCTQYPYLDTLKQFPKDYLWMFFATILILTYVVLMTSIHSFAVRQKKIFSQIGLSFAVITAVILLINYFVQFSIVPVSLLNGETEGIPLWIQYNSHGIFIALEDLGYLMMSFSFGFMAFIFNRKNRLEAVVRWIFTSGFLLTIISLVVISIIYGVERKDRFEVLALSIDWLVLIINGILLSIVFKRQLK